MNVASYPSNLDNDDYSCSSNDFYFAQEAGETNGKETATKTASALMVAASAKAGMEDIDRERINAILLRESGNSSFMERQRKMDENSNKRILEMKQRLSEKDNNTTNKEWRIEMERSVIDPQIETYRALRRPLSTCVVIDMDSFFISCHILDQPHLADIPSCVGGSSMISTSNYVARKYGVRAAMPGYLGSTLVKELSGGKDCLTFVKSDFNLYKRKSAEVKAILEEYDPKLKMYSLDEAYMDIMPYLEVKMNDESMIHEAITKHLNTISTNNLKPQLPLHEAFSVSTIHADVQNLLTSIRQRVKDVTGLSCSAGIASNFLLAKIASDINKPNGQHFVGSAEQQILDFIQPLPIRKIHGIGRVMEKTLYGVCGIEHVQDLYDHRAEVQFLFKRATADFLLRASIGFSDCNKHREDSAEDDDDEAIHRKGISHERTFAPTSNWSDLCNKLETITLCLVQDLRERNLMPKTVTLKVKLASFDILTRAVTRNVAFVFDQNNTQSSSAQELVDVAVNLMKEAKRVRDKKLAKGCFSVRLLGVRCSNFQLHKETQFSLDRYRRKTSQSPIINPYASPKRDVVANSTNEEAKDAPSLNLGQISCPMCTRIFQSDQNQELNSHVDSCLNAPTVRELCKEETASADERAKKKQKRTLNDFFIA
jgi:DNA polymerase kappa